MLVGYRSRSPYGCRAALAWAASGNPALHPGGEASPAVPPAGEVSQDRPPPAPWQHRAGRAPRHGRRTSGQDKRLAMLSVRRRLGRGWALPPCAGQQIVRLRDGALPDGHGRPDREQAEGDETGRRRDLQVAGEVAGGEPDLDLGSTPSRLKPMGTRPWEATSRIPTSHRALRVAALGPESSTAGAVTCRSGGGPRWSRCISSAPRALRRRAAMRPPSQDSSTPVAIPTRTPPPAVAAGRAGRRGAPGRSRTPPSGPRAAASGTAGRAAPRWHLGSSLVSNGAE
jgi:hypothetical protein